jgi:hypothetical protein
LCGNLNGNLRSAADPHVPSFPGAHMSPTQGNTGTRRASIVGNTD